MSLEQTEHFQLLGAGGELCAAGVVGENVCAQRPIGNRCRRDLGEALGQEEGRSQRHLPRPRTLTHERFIKASCPQLGVPGAFGARALDETHLALPFLSVLAPSKRYATQRGKRHKKITE
jgi:hypothetical protein